MITDKYQIIYGKNASDIPMDPESDQHLFEMFLSDHINNQVQRIMEGVGLSPKTALEFKEF